MSCWAERAGAVIWPIVSAGEKAGTPPRDILKQIDSAYPFGPRDYHPYKVWLSVRREAQKRLGLTTQPRLPRDSGPLFGGQS
ncbi:hypothetical protein [Deinococcus wulumuqiensis]|uniref:hypothetical protein n=1 Tax=Deinococcus wulumuqiensis TaxID=980427 RepID=UPI00242B2148|nr:hypothetical protein [Deinococcus wulumuqiensis]